jgi:hypothetical protein
VTGTFTIGPLGGAEPNLVPIALDDEDNVVAPTSGDKWLVFQSDTKIDADVDYPVFNTTIWALDPDPGNPVKKLRLRAK